MVPTRNYQYTTNGTESQSMRFTSDYFEIVLPEAAAGQEVLINVTFQNGPCSNMSSTTYDGKIICLCSICICSLTPGRFLLIERRRKIGLVLIVCGSS